MSHEKDAGGQAEFPAGDRDADRKRRIDAVLADLGRRLAAGESVDEAAVIQAHPDLMPELGRLLRSLQRLRQAPQQARQPEPAGPLDPELAHLTEELRVLQEALEGYDVLERVRFGGQGVVYKARQQGPNRVVALKLLLNGPLATERERIRFEREIELVSRLRHPNIVTVYESGTVRGRNFYAMEFVDGLPIDDYALLEDLSPPAIVQLMIKVCRAVHHAHLHGIIHRDLNPANVLVDEAGEPRVFDFGLAKDLWADPTRSLTGDACGTLQYLSPEQAGLGLGGVDVRSDTYALGLVLYRLLTRQLPYPTDGEAAHVRMTILEADPLPLRRAFTLAGPEGSPAAGTVNRDLEVILAKALAKAKQDRYQTAADLADDLERWLAGDAVQARAGSRLYVLRKTLRKYRLTATLAAVIVAALLVSIVSIAVSSVRVRQERDSARAAARTAYGLFDLALTDVEESVRPLAGGVAVRDRLVGQLSAKLPEMAALVQSDAALHPIEIRLTEKQGDIACQQGRRADAAGFYQAFLDDRLRCAEQEPDSSANAEDVIRGYRKLAEAADAPVPLFQRGAAFGDTFVRHEPASPMPLYELCELRLSFGEHLLNAVGAHEALSEFDRVLVATATIREPSPPGGRWLRLQAKGLNGKAIALQKLGRGTEGRQASAQALELRQQIVAQDPANMEARLALLRSYDLAAVLSRNAGEPEEAKRLFRAAAEQADLLASMDPGCTVWDDDRYKVHHCLGSLCLDTGDLEEARTHVEKANAIARAQAARDNTEPAQTTLFFALVLQGKLHKREQAWDAARCAYQDALTLGETFLERDPQNPAWISRVAMACDGLAYCIGEQGEHPAALPHRRRAHELCEGLLTLKPDMVETALNALQCQVNLATAHIALRTPDDWAVANHLLAEAENRLAALAAGGKLVGWERQSQYIRGALTDQRRALADQPSNAHTPSGTAAKGR